jgi:hypothetical protein
MLEGCVNACINLSGVIRYGVCFFSAFVLVRCQAVAGSRHLL